MPHTFFTKFSAHLLMNHVIKYQVSILILTSQIGNLEQEEGRLAAAGDTAADAVARAWILVWCLSHAAATSTSNPATSS